MAFRLHWSPDITLGQVAQALVVIVSAVVAVVAVLLSQRDDLRDKISALQGENREQALRIAALETDLRDVKKGEADFAGEMRRSLAELLGKFSDLYRDMAVKR